MLLVQQLAYSDMVPALSVRNIYLDFHFEIKWPIVSLLVSFTVTVAIFSGFPNKNLFQFLGRTGPYIMGIKMPKF